MIAALFSYLGAIALGALALKFLFWLFGPRTGPLEQANDELRKQEKKHHG